MPTLNYAAPSTVDEAVKLLAGASGLAKVLSGGTDLLVQLRSGRLKPELIVDTKHIPGTIGIREEAGGFVVGAATPGAVVEAHAGMNKAWPGVVEALDLIGSTQIQGRCSLAGNLCNASPAADSVPALYAAGAIAVVVGSKGRREVAVEQIPTAPGRTSLAKDEFILEFKFPPRPPHSGDAYLRFIPRTEMDIAVVGVGISVTLDAKGVCTAARVGWARWRQRCCCSRRPLMRWLGIRSTRRHWRSWMRRRAGRASRSTTSAERSNIARRWPACWRAVWPRSPSIAQWARRKGRLTDEQASRNHHNQWRGDRIPL